LTDIITQNSTGDLSEFQMKTYAAVPDGMLDKMKSVTASHGIWDTLATISGAASTLLICVIVFGVMTRNWSLVGACGVGMYVMTYF